MNETKSDIDIDFLNRLLYHREELTEAEIEEWLSVEDNRKLLDEAAMFNATLNPFRDKSSKERERIRLISKIMRPRETFRGLDIGICLDYCLGRTTFLYERLR